MQTLIFRRLIWKEFRQQRDLWIAIALFGLLLQAIVVFTGHLEASRLVVALYSIALGVPVLYALGCGATLFAGEHDNDTFDFQRWLPVASTTVFWSKVTFALVSSIVMPVVLVLLATIWSRGAIPTRETSAQLVIGSAVAGAELLAWSVLFSLLLKRTLWVVVLAAGVAASAGLATGFATMVFNIPRAFDPYSASLPWRMVVVMIVVVANVALGRRWLNEWPLMRRNRAGHATTRNGAGTSIGITSRFARLVWQEGRQSGVMALVLLLLFGMWLLSIVLNDPRNWLSLWSREIVVPNLFATLLGACTFLSDQRQSHFRFFAEQGVSARLVWWSRQCFWFIPILIWSVIAAFLPWPETYVASPFTSSQLMLLAMTAFATAQVSSALVRSNVVAFFLGVMMAGVTVVWTIVMCVAQVPLWFSAAPLPLCFWLATWYRAPAWIDERGGWRTTAITAALLGLPVVAVMVMAAAYRAYEIPVVETPQLQSTPVAHDVIAASETSRRYRDVWLALQAVPASELTSQLGAEATGTATPPPTGPAGATAATTWEERLSTDSTVRAELAPLPQPWTDEQVINASIAVFLGTSQREAISAEIDENRFSAWSWSNVLAAHVLRQANAWRDAGELERAWEVYQAVGRFAGQMHRLNNTWDMPSDRNRMNRTYLTSNIELAMLEQRNALSVVAGKIHLTSIIELAMLEQLPAWGAHPQQTPDLIRSALDELAQSRAFMSIDWQAMNAEMHRLVRDYVREPRKSQDHPASHRWMPWERIRWQRLVDYQLQQSAAKVGRIVAVLQSGDQLTRLGDIGPDSRVLRWRATTPGVEVGDISFVLIDMELQYRATRLQLAMLGYQVEHGSLPQSFAELERDWLTPVPADPYTGRSFVYRPGKFPWTVRAMHPGSDTLGIPTTLHLAQGMLWSPGSRLVYVGQVESPAQAPNSRDYRLRTTDGSTWDSQMHSEQVIWNLGKSFMVPRAASMPAVP